MKIRLTHIFFVVTAFLLAVLLIFGGRVHAQQNAPEKEKMAYIIDITPLASGYVIEINPTQP